MRRKNLYFLVIKIVSVFLLALVQFNYFRDPFANCLLLNNLNSFNALLPLFTFLDVEQLELQAKKLS